MSLGVISKRVGEPRKVPVGLQTSSHVLLFCTELAMNLAAPHKLALALLGFGLHGLSNSSPTRCTPPGTRLAAVVAIDTLSILYSRIAGSFIRIAEVSGILKEGQVAMTPVCDWPGAGIAERFQRFRNVLHVYGAIVPYL